MGRLIDVDAAIEALNTQAEEMSHWSERYQEQRRGVLTAVNIVADCPSVQPERKTGHWILDRSGAYCCGKCLEPCATYAMMKPRDKYCKMCGAKMEGERKE